MPLYQIILLLLLLVLLFINAYYKNPIVEGLESDSFWCKYFSWLPGVSCDDPAPAAAAAAAAAAAPAAASAAASAASGSSGSSSTSAESAEPAEPVLPYALQSSITDKEIFEPDPTLGSGYITGCPTKDRKTRSDGNKRYKVASSDPKHSSYNDGIYVGIAMNGNGGDGTGSGTTKACASSSTHTSSVQDPCSQIVKNTASSDALDCNRFYYYNRNSDAMMPCGTSNNACVGQLVGDTRF
tara:strand:- start:73 stop:792 length:720 start_codon:yes stop_codon:yes gene_type:complete